MGDSPPNTYQSPGKDREDARATGASGATGRVSGQGSHFPKSEDISGDTGGSLQGTTAGYIPGTST